MVPTSTSRRVGLQIPWFGGEDFEGGVWITVQPEYAVNQQCNNGINHC